MPRVLAEKLQSVVTRIQSATDNHGLLDAIAGGFRTFGFDGFQLALNFTTAEQLMATPYKKCVAEAGQPENLGLTGNDPIVGRILAGADAFTFNTHELAQAANGVTYPRWNKLVLECPALCGAVIPLPSPAGLRSVAIVGASHPFDRLAIDCAGIVARVAQMRAEVIEPFDVRDDRTTLAANLTAVQVEMLGWASKGKSNSDIAIITGHSKRTVDYHMSEILRKLNVSRRSQAIALLASVKPG